MLTGCEALLSMYMFKNLILFTYSYFIKEGRVSEAGTHDQLILRRGDYYDYVQLQALSKH
jgi:hypothetical protein